jgi:hypothetical protein
VRLSRDEPSRTEESHDSGCAPLDDVQPSTAPDINVQAFLRKHLIGKTWKRKRQTLCRNLELIIRTANHLRFPLRNEHLDAWFRPVQEWHDLAKSLPDVPSKYPKRWVSFR